MSVAPPRIPPSNVKRFRRLLLQWFAKHQRTLPWRGETDPYRILVSEIMLQQTRVAAVLDRYKQFVRRFPTAQRLARAHEQTVLAAWSGLGYYRRARSLHAVAKILCQKGGFPRDSATLRQLPGVGRYTANAVASIAFAEPVAVVDGNVQRVLRRVLGRNLPLQECWQCAEQLLDARYPGDFNQAMMELGALICLPGAPRCDTCPVAALCRSRSAGPKQRQVARRKAKICYLLARRNGSVLLRQRPASSRLMPGMWELPRLEPAATTKQTPILKLRHSITTTDYAVSVFTGFERASRQHRWVPLGAAENLPLTGLARKILRKIRSSELRSRTAQAR